jgi:hypothetical protein
VSTVLRPNSRLEGAVTTLSWRALSAPRYFAPASRSICLRADAQAHR